MTAPAAVPSETEVAVIGGGPGGSTVATTLARQGRQVLLLEREHFPRDHVGESLLPATMPILEELGVAEDVAAAGFLEKWGASMVWGVDHERWHWRFEEASRQYPHSYQVVRAEFDRILLDHAAASGVDVRQGARVTSVEPREDATSTLHLATAEGESSVEARSVVDASGQSGLLARARGLRQWDGFPQPCGLRLLRRRDASRRRGGDEHPRRGDGGGLGLGHSLRAASARECRQRRRCPRRPARCSAAVMRGW